FYFAWSLATEEQFYLLWPFVVRSFRSAWGPVVFMAGLLGLALFARWGVSAGQLDTHLLGVRMMASISPSICMGCLAAYLTHSPRTFAWVWRVLGQAWSVPLAVGLMAVALYRYDTPAWLVSLLLTVLVVAMCVRPRHVLTPLVEHPWLRYIGGITYGIYLLHMLSLNVVRRVVPFHDVTVYFVLTLGLSVVLATLSYRYFETPFLKLKHRFDWRGDKPPAPAPRPVASTSPSAS
ncbi:MAG TPA: acyltransferase, partial [Archangium sp.]|uniref:acyltransferase family protein n=1 Tax=Archangium sp. TaxID=1872627 RepID=UPI002ED8D861